jgi:hypothetical protein
MGGIAITIATVPVPVIGVGFLPPHLRRAYHIPPVRPGPVQQGPQFCQFLRLLAVPLPIALVRRKENLPGFYTLIKYFVNVFSIREN